MTVEVVTGKEVRARRVDIGWNMMDVEVRSIDCF